MGDYAPAVLGEPRPAEPWTPLESSGKQAKKLAKEVNLFLNLAMRRDEHADNRGYALSHYALNIHVARANVGNLAEKTSRTGLSNTLMAGEVNGHFKPWGDPVNWAATQALASTARPTGLCGGKGYGRAVPDDGRLGPLPERNHQSGSAEKAFSMQAGGENS